MATITTSDLLNPNKSERNDSLFGQFGMDAGGNNEIGAWLRRFAQSAGQSAAGGFGLQNELDPQRQAAIRSLFELLSPANMINNAKSQGQTLQAGARDAGARNAAQLGQFGANAGAQLGAINQQQNAGVNASNQLLMNAQSPASQSDALMRQLQVFQQAVGPGFEQLLAMFSPIEGRSAMNASQKSQGGFGGALGGILGSVLPGLNMGGIFGGAQQPMGGNGSSGGVTPPASNSNSMFGPPRFGG